MKNLTCGIFFAAYLVFSTETGGRWNNRHCAPDTCWFIRMSWREHKSKWLISNQLSPTELLWPHSAPTSAPRSDPGWGGGRLRPPGAICWTTPETNSRPSSFRLVNASSLIFCFLIFNSINQSDRLIFRFNSESMIYHSPSVWSAFPTCVCLYQSDLTQGQITCWSLVGVMLSWRTFFPDESHLG